MEDDTRLTINVGDVEIDMVGGQSEIEERLTRIKEDGQWEILLEQIKIAVENSDVSDTVPEGLCERGKIFRAMVENCNLDRKPDQILASIHYLRSSEGVDEARKRNLVMWQSKKMKMRKLQTVKNEMIRRGVAKAVHIRKHVYSKNIYCQIK